MAVKRVNKTTDYTVMSNFHLKDKQLTLKAKGLLSMILSLPDDWNYTIGGLVAICLESESAVKSALNELKKYGYLKVDKICPNKENGGRFEYVYNIFEQPYEKQEVEKQEVENQPLENQPLENRPLYKDTNKSNTNNKINNNKNTKKKERKNTSYDEILSTVTDDSLKELYLEYIKMRKLNKSPMTDRALTMLINKVNSLEPNSIERQKQMLEAAIMGNWKSVYPLKDVPANQSKMTGGNKNERIDGSNTDVGIYL